MRLHPLAWARLPLPCLTHAAPVGGGNARAPGEGGCAQREWQRPGSDGIDQASTARHEDHDLLHLRAYRSLNKQLALYGGMHNLLDWRHATSVSGAHRQRLQRLFNQPRRRES